MSETYVGRITTKYDPNTDTNVPVIIDPAGGMDRILDALHRYIGQTVRITIDDAQEMTVNYNDKNFTIRTFTDTIEITCPMTGGSWKRRFARNDPEDEHDFAKAQFAVYHMWELLDDLGEPS